MENSHSGTGGSSNYEHVIYDHSWSLDLPWDEDNQPDNDLGIVEGNKIGIRFKHGDGDVKEAILNTLVGPLETRNNTSNDIVRVRITGKGGVLQ